MPSYEQWYARYITNKHHNYLTSYTDGDVLTFFMDIVQALSIYVHSIALVTEKRATIYWSYSTVRKYSKPYLRTLGIVPRDTLPSVRTDFIRLGSVTTNRKNGLAGEQLAVGTGSRSVSTGPSRMFSVLTEGCHVGYSREFVGTVYCTYGQSNTTNVCHSSRISYTRIPPRDW